MGLFNISCYNHGVASHHFWVSFMFIEWSLRFIDCTGKWACRSKFCSMSAHSEKEWSYLKRNSSKEQDCSIGIRQNIFFDPKHRTYFCVCLTDGIARIFFSMNFSHLPCHGQESNPRQLVELHRTCVTSSDWATHKISKHGLTFTQRMKLESYFDVETALLMYFDLP